MLLRRADVNDQSVGCGESCMNFSTGRLRMYLIIVLKEKTRVVTRKHYQTHYQSNAMRLAKVASNKKRENLLIGEIEEKRKKVCCWSNPMKIKPMMGGSF